MSSSSSSSKALAVDVADAPAYWSLGELLTLVATAEQTGGAFSLMDERLPPDGERVITSAAHHGAGVLEAWPEPAGR